MEGLLCLLQTAESESAASKHNIKCQKQSPGSRVQGPESRPSYSRPSYSRPSYARPSYARPCYSRPSYGCSSNTRPSGKGNNLPIRRDRWCLIIGRLPNAGLEASRWMFPLIACYVETSPCGVVLNRCVATGCYF